MSALLHGTRSPTVLRAATWESLSWLVHGFSTRLGGGADRDFNLDQEADENGRRMLGPNHDRFLHALAGDDSSWQWLAMRQVHGSVVWHDPNIGLAGDALTTDRPGRLLAVRTADCVPILLAAESPRVVAAVHAGWRGTQLGIVGKAVGELRAHYGALPERVRAVLGPSIRACCYRVGEEVRQAFTATWRDVDDLFVPTDPDPDRLRYPLRFLNGAPPGHAPGQRWNLEPAYLFDLAEANRRQLLAAGVAAESIEVLDYCTSCRADLFFSHRRSGAGAGRMMAAIGLRP